MVGFNKDKEEYSMEHSEMCWLIYFPNGNDFGHNFPWENSTNIMKEFTHAYHKMLIA